MTEIAATKYSPAIIDQVVSEMAFNDDGLIPAIAQQNDTGEILMMAWMNADALRETMTTGRVCYWSRSRQSLWRKGETSGQTQALVDLRWDCDNDTVLLLVDQMGVACHTGRRSCFFKGVRNDETVDLSDVEIDPGTLYGGSDS